MLALASIQSSMPVTLGGVAPNRETTPEIGDSLASIRSVQYVGANQPVFFEGDSADDIFEVKEGVVRIYKVLIDGRRQIIGFIYPGQIMGVSVHGHYAYTAEAVSDVILHRYHRRKLEELINTEPAVRHRMLRLTTDELVAAQDQMLLLGRKQASEKIASFFIRLSEFNEQAEKDPSMIFLPMNRRDIGDYLGLTVETVSRVVTRFKERGLIRTQRHNHIELTDIDGLLDLSQGNETYQ